MSAKMRSKRPEKIYFMMYQVAKSHTTDLGMRRRINNMQFWLIKMIVN